MSEKEEQEKEGGVESSNTINLEVHIDSHHSEMKEEMEASDIDVESIISNQLMPDIEGEIYKLYQQAKYNQTE